MRSPAVHGARALLVGLLIYGVARVVDPEQRWAAGQVGADRIEHALLVYALLTSALAAFPRLSVRLAAGVMLGAGAAVELLQGVPGFPGNPQLGDMVADILGVVLAATAFLAGRGFRSAQDGAKP